MKNIVIYDTTLRDGNQAEDVNLSLEDKIKITLKLDELGVAYVEGGWPGASPVDTAYFQEIAAYDLKHARIAAFGSTYHPSGTAETDPNLAALIKAKPQVATIFGKTCEVHTREALRVAPEAYLPVVRDSVAHLRRHLPEVIFDAEHFFDGYKRNHDYALAVLRTALEAGASYLVLCDTNGGGLPADIIAAVKDVRKELPTAALGVHPHNDCELAVANAVAAVEAGAIMVQGTINGVGERCGNANLCSIMPVLELKYDKKYRCCPRAALNICALFRTTCRKSSTWPPSAGSPL
jgi:2-isopropylmalate synthase